MQCAMASLPCCISSQALDHCGIHVSNNEIRRTDIKRVNNGFHHGTVCEFTLSQLLAPTRFFLILDSAILTCCPNSLCDGCGKLSVSVYRRPLHDTNRLRLYLDVANASGNSNTIGVSYRLLSRNSYVSNDICSHKPSSANLLRRNNRDFIRYFAIHPIYPTCMRRYHSPSRYGTIVASPSAYVTISLRYTIFALASSAR